MSDNTFAYTSFVEENKKQDRALREEVTGLSEAGWSLETAAGCLIYIG